MAIAGGQARLYERGLAISGAVTAEVRFAFPMIAKPDIVSGGASFALPVMRFDPQGAAVEPIAAAIFEAIGSRLALAAVGQPATRVTLAVGEAKPLFEATSPPYGIGVSSDELQDRQLYDVVLRGGDDQWHVIAPHALYRRASWTDFNIAHITDMHVARRIDAFRGILKNAGRGDAAERMYNWNDRFRGFVKYANYLHSYGLLDVIVTTGDNYDYQFENLDSPLGGGNAAFLRDLILGKEPGEFPDVEELRVPIFMVPGNHDYRVHPYTLIFDLHIDDDLRTKIIAVAGFMMGALTGPLTGPLGAAIGAALAAHLTRKDVQRVPSYSSYRLTADDAAVIANALREVSGTEVPNLEPADAKRMVEFDKDNLAYARCLGVPGSYVINLGPHRIAMIDSAHDEGVVTEQLAAILVKLGFGTEDQNAFVGASPNCRGVLPGVLDMITTELDKTEGLFIVGLHAPLFNPPFDEYSYFARETQRAAQKDQIHAYLASRTTVPTPNPDKVLEVIEAAHPSWFVDHDSNVRDHRPPSYVKRVSGEDAFDWGVSRGEAEELMKRLAGIGTRRPADLVLAGHTHFHNEYSVRRDAFSGELAYYFDFYTENPANYYRTTFKRAWERVQIDANLAGTNAVLDETYIEVSPYALPDATPWPMPFDALTKNMLQVPPYPNPLNSAADPRAWWNEHRPLVLQTGALGPLQKEPFFAGFRVIAVKNNVIDKVHFISSARLEENQFRLSWEQAIAPEAGRAYHYVERSRPLEAPLATGVPSGISFPAIGATNVVYRDGDGRLHELWRKGDQAGTSDLTTLGSNAMPAASDASSYIDPVDGVEVALYRGTDQHVYSLYWSTGEVKRDALSVTAGAPTADGIPVGYVSKDGYRHVIYRAQDGTLHELYWTGGDPPQGGNLTTKAEAPHAVGDPVAYNKPTTNENIVIFRGRNQHVYGMYWFPTEVKPRFEDLSGFAHAPNAEGNASAYYTTHDDTHQIVYRGSYGHIHELWWKGNTPVSHWDLTEAMQGAPHAADDATGDPVSYYAAGNNTKHVIYRSADGRLNELSWTPGSATPTFIDLTAYAVAPLAADKPTAFVVAPNTQHVLYRGKDNQIHEIRWTQPVTRRIPDVTNVVDAQPANIVPARWHRPMPSVDITRTPR